MVDGSLGANSNPICHDHSCVSLHHYAVNLGGDQT